MFRAGRPFLVNVSDNPNRSLNRTRRRPADEQTTEQDDERKEKESRDKKDEKKRKKSTKENNFNGTLCLLSNLCRPNEAAALAAVHV